MEEQEVEFMSKSVYITRLAKFLPNKPISNEEMENYLGLVDGNLSKAKPLVLRNNKIKTRYYALDENGNLTHNNAQLTAEAIRLLTNQEFNIEDIEMLACGTTSPDQLLPSHASMVHGEIRANPVEIISPSGSCCSGMHALKFGYLSILSGEKRNAVCTGSELLSVWMQAKNFKKESDKLHELEEHPIIAFEKDFLRWMLSDGAGAALLSDKQNKSGISLRIDWIDSISYANELETCMYAGGEKMKDGRIKGWRMFEPDELLDRSLFALRQDVGLLGENIVQKSGIFLTEIVRKRNLDLQKVDYFLPHLSSEFFRKKIEQEFKRLDIDIPQEKWFTNLTRFGNVGAASIYLMLEELFHSGNLKKNDIILCGIPESSRFTYVYSLMTVV
jgi:3-oxoacyl-[acyl-carrier-protein] synthase-3